MSYRGGRYEMLSTIASGGMATVHLGRIVGAGGFERLVAIKVMHEQLVGEPEFVAMFLDEARLAAQIHHPNVVATLDVQQDEEGVFLVMEYVEGPSFHQMLKTLRKENKKLSLPLSLRVMMDTLAGLHAAHELTAADGSPLNLVHRDVSPQNILVGVDGIAKLTDFGVARAEARLAGMTRDGAIKGKISYMAPEQAKSMGVDKRTDIYAAGLVFWEILTGRRAFQGKLDVAMLTKILGGVQTPPHVVNPDVPPGISAICMRALAVEPNQRYASAAEFAEELEFAASAEGVAIATSRALSAFVKELGAHEGRAELLAAGSPNSKPPVSLRTPQPTSAPIVTASTLNTPISVPNPDKVSGSSGSGVRSDPLLRIDTAPRSDTPPVSTNAPVAAPLVPEPQVTIDVEPALRPKSRKALWIGLSAVAAVGVAALALFGLQDQPQPAANSGEQHAEPPVTAPSVPIANAEPTNVPTADAKPAESAAAPAPTQAVEPTAAEPAASTAPAASAQAKVRGKPGPLIKPPPQTTSTQPPGDGPSFRPKDL